MLNRRPMGVRQLRLAFKETGVRLHAQYFVQPAPVDEGHQTLCVNSSRITSGTIGNMTTSGQWTMNIRQYLCAADVDVRTLHANTKYYVHANFAVRSTGEWWRNVMEIKSWMTISDELVTSRDISCTQLQWTCDRLWLVQLTSNTRVKPQKLMK